jgi:hypothetical protein
MKLSPSETRESVQYELNNGRLTPEYLYSWGKGICDARGQGLSRQQILMEPNPMIPSYSEMSPEENYYRFWGPELSEAMYDAALETICPDLR